MRVLEYLTSGGSQTDRRVGRVDDDGVVDLTEPLGLDYRGMVDLLSRVDWQAAAAGVDGPSTPLSDIEYLPLLVDHGRVFAAGLNYEKKYPAGKQLPTPKFPPWFGKLPGTLVGHEQPVVAPSVHESFDYEVELVAIIGTGGRHISADNALGHVAGWTAMNDGSVRGWQRHSVNAGKNFERSGSIGPWMVTAEQIADPQNVHLLARVDGDVRQDANTSTMVFTVAEIIAYLSQSIELRPGDVIATGSPEGTGGSFDPPKFLTVGQTVEIEVEGVGILRNHVIAEDPA